MSEYPVSHQLESKCVADPVKTLVFKVESWLGMDHQSCHYRLLKPMKNYIRLISWENEWLKDVAQLEICRVNKEWTKG